jgi:uncharacterized membrane protein YkoI
MTMKLSLLWIGLLLGLVAVGCTMLGGSKSASSAKSGGSSAAVATGDEDDDDDEQEIDLSQVPQAVKDAAIAAVPGLVLQEAEVETENGATVYCLEGTANGTEYEVEVTSSGQVLEVEEEDDDDDDGDDDDDD